MRNLLLAVSIGFAALLVGGPVTAMLAVAVVTPAAAAFAS